MRAQSTSSGSVDLFSPSRGDFLLIGQGTKWLRLSHTTHARYHARRNYYLSKNNPVKNVPVCDHHQRGNYYCDGMGTGMVN